MTIQDGSSIRSTSKYFTWRQHLFMIVSWSHIKAQLALSRYRGCYRWPNSVLSYQTSPTCLAVTTWPAPGPATVAVTLSSACKYAQAQARPGKYFMFPSIWSLLSICNLADFLLHGLKQIIRSAKRWMFDSLLMKGAIYLASPTSERT